MGLDLDLADSGEKSEGLDVFGEVFEFDFEVGVFVEVVKGDPVEVGDDEVTGQFVAPALVDHVLDVAHCLAVGFSEVFACGFVLSHQDAFPEQVDEVFSRPGDLFHGVFEGCDFAAAASEHVEEAIPEGFGFGVFAGFPGP